MDYEADALPVTFYGDPLDVFVALDELLERRRPEGMRDAACRGRTDVDFFPTTINASSPAKKLCARGPVRVDCYEYAVGQGAVGIWGGRGMGQRSRSTAITDDVIPSTACPVR